MIIWLCQKARLKNLYLNNNKAQEIESDNFEKDGLRRFWCPTQDGDFPIAYRRMFDLVIAKEPSFFNDFKFEKFDRVSQRLIIILYKKKGKNLENPNRK